MIADRCGLTIHNRDRTRHTFILYRDKSVLLGTGQKNRNVTDVTNLNRETRIKYCDKISEITLKMIYF